MSSHPKGGGGDPCKRCRDRCKHVHQTSCPPPLPPLRPSGVGRGGGGCTTAHAGTGRETYSRPPCDHMHMPHTSPSNALCTVSTPRGERLQPVLMRQPPQLSVKTWGGGGGGGGAVGGVQPGVVGGGQAGGRGGVLLGVGGGGCVAGGQGGVQPGLRGGWG